VQGGTLRMQMDIKAQRDPRTWDWSELANVCRGWLEYLVQFERDGSVTPVLLESWEASDDATEYTPVRAQGVTWNNGDDLHRRARRTTSNAGPTPRSRATRWPGA
jgi:peptide/nickel transport system substrate-binding protein